MKGNLDLEKRRDLEEGEAAAKSIMTRADEAVQKEHHAAAVNELQSRVEDWKGHKINHFGELLHYGNYTVLKGEGAKVVEREVSVIFDSLEPFTRAMVFSLSMRSLNRGAPKPLFPHSWTSAFEAMHRKPLEYAQAPLRLQLPDPALSPAACADADTTAPVVESKRMTKLEKRVADELAIESLVHEQYKVYLFERILLCCKEINPNKPKNKVLAAKQPLVDKKGKPKLQLKGRIFMQNVTDVVTLSKHSTKAKCCL